MIIVHKTTNEELIRKLCFWEPNLTHDYYVINKDAQGVGIFEIQPMSKICGNLHIHIQPEYQKQGICMIALGELRKTLKVTNFQQLIATIPAHNTNILKLVKTSEAKCCGLIKNAIIYNKVLQDLIIFQLEV